MIKKFFIALFLGSIGLNFYLLNVEVVIKDDLDSDIMEIDDRVSFAQSAPVKTVTIKDNQKQEKKQVDLIVNSAKRIGLSENEKKTDTSFQTDFISEDDYQKIKVKVSKSIEGFFQNSNYNTASQFETYSKLSDEYEKEMSTIYNEKKPYKDSKGRSIFWNTLEDDVTRGKITADYLMRLRDELGEEGYKEYQSFKDSYNRKAFKEDRAHHLIMF